MRKTLIFSSVMACTVCAATALASGYRIPEQSLNGTALSNAYLANAHRADAAYYNPANMVFLEDGILTEVGLNNIYLPSTEYKDARTPAFDGDSESEIFAVPNLHIVSPKVNDFRFGFSIALPAGLAKKWEDPFPKTFAEEFSMTTVEAAPSASYKINDMISIAGGVRFIYSDARVKSNGTVVALPPASAASSPEFVTLTRNMDGDTFEFGYNLALAVKPIDNLSIGATYRSKVDMDFEGDAKLAASPSFPGGIIPGATYNGDGKVSAPLPAVLAFGIAYTFDRSTIEFEYDRTFWSDYETLDFQYPVSLGHPLLINAFDNPVAKDWDDVDAYRLGCTFQWSDDLDLMAGFGIDGNPVPDATLSFDLPDSDAWFISFGARYDVNEKLNIGGAYLYADKEDRTVVNSTINGEFSGTASHLLAISASYIF